VSAPILLGIVAALATLVGAVAVARHAPRGLAIIDYFVCFSAGFMLALALAAAIPEALRVHPQRSALIVLLGYLLVHLSQHTIAPHFHFGQETHHLSETASKAAVAGLGLHTFFDGVAIASGFLVNPTLGVLFFLAIALHKLPEGVAVGSLVLAAGGSVRASYFAAGLMGLMTVAGVVLTDRVALLTEYGLALSAGVTIYVAASNLVPEFQHQRTWRTALSFFAGAGAFVATEWVLGRVVG
jgi:ZIP family zinc transporter/zinc and cadmium transporter